MISFYIPLKRSLVWATGITCLPQIPEALSAKSQKVSVLRVGKVASTRGGGGGGGAVLRGPSDLRSRSLVLPFF